MEPEKQPTERGGGEGRLPGRDSPPSRDQRRSKTDLRRIFEIEAQNVQTKFGSLEEMRLRLGLSGRKLCQLLLVDPSAWNRWTRPGAKAPPHIYRALEWYFHLQEKHPTMDHRYWLTGLARSGLAKTSATEVASEQMAKLQSEIKELREELQRLASKRDKRSASGSEKRALARPRSQNRGGWLGRVVRLWR